VTPTALVTEVSGTPTAEATDDATEEPETPEPEETAAEPTQSALREYVVQDGDTLLSIAEATAPPGVDAFIYSEQIAFLNGFGPEDPIQPGDVLILP
jgi:nucleoid-associated protein YgaU